MVDLFVAQGYEVVIVDDLSTGRTSNLNPAAKFYQMDIRSPQLREVFEAEKPDYVSHHAAQMDVRRSVAQPLFDADINILGSINLLEIAKYGVFGTPAVVVDGEVKCVGKIPTKDDVKKWIENK